MLILVRGDTRRADRWQLDPPAAAYHKRPDALHDDCSCMLSNLALCQGERKLYETPLIEMQQLTSPARGAAVFQLKLPLKTFKPGFYVCQLNVVDDAGGHFLFPRVALLIRQ